MRKKILWVVTARSGSKSIPHKNIKLLDSIPLLSYRIKTALKTKFSHDLWISTDSKEYADIANRYGAEIPFIRPEELSLDDSSSSDVILHAMAHATKINKKYDYVGMLEPTSPFITSDQLDAAVRSLDENKKALAIVAVVESRPHKIFIQEESEFLVELAENFEGLKNLGRQAFKKEITPSGGFYISRWEAFLEKKSFYTSKTLSYEVDEISGLEIDEPLDWDFAEFIIKNKQINEIK
jgi:N-acylneuraminate cytidylyltransferase/CMP-N,N'-diacetyllegionaminic acid synthase